MKNVKTWSLLAGAACLMTAATAQAGDHCSASATNYTHANFEAAQTQAAQADLPILVKVGTEWCTACNSFDSASTSDADMKKALHKNVVYYRVDAEKGNGAEFAKTYNVHNYPSFLLLNAEGEVMDRWAGFKSADHFTTSLTKATKDPVTMQARMQRFTQDPNATDAAKLAEFRSAEGLYAEATALYKRAGQLDKSAGAKYDVQAFHNVAMGSWKGTYTMSDVKQHADVVFASNHAVETDLLKCAKTMAKVAAVSGEGDAHLPYLTAAVERTADSKDETVQKYRAVLLPDYALHVEKNADRAVELKKAAMYEGWKENANELNNFAWWCFQNNINLDEAEKIARQGVELAAAGTEKANILDTLAEICNAKGDCGDAVNLIEMAMAEAPENEYFKKQHVRFQELVAQQR